MPIPHRCPVCGGKGQVPSDFYSPFTYSTTLPFQQCRACCGSGILWESTGEGEVDINFKFKPEVPIKSSQ